MGKVERCHLWWGADKRIFNKGRGRGNNAAHPHNVSTKCKKNCANGDTVAKKGSRETIATGPKTIKKCQRICPETTALRQYLGNVSGVELPKWAAAAGLRPRLRNGIICFKTERKNQENPDQIFVPLAIRVLLTKRMHVGTQAGHVGYKKTLAKLRQNYIWGSMALNAQRVINTCI